MDKFNRVFQHLLNGSGLIFAGHGLFVTKAMERALWDTGDMRRRGGEPQDIELFMLKG